MPLPTFRKKDLPLLLVCVALFLGLFFLFGPQLCLDSDVYLDGSPDVGFVYPLFVDGFQALFGEGCLPALALVQNLLMAYALYALLCDLTRRFALRGWEQLLLAACVWGCFLIQRFATRRGYITTNTLMTEGLSLPLYFMAFRYLYALWLDRDPKCLLPLAGLCFLLTNTRGQMYWFVGLAAVLGLIVVLGRLRAAHASAGRRWLAAGLAVVCVAGYAGLSTLAADGYQLATHGRTYNSYFGRRVVLSAAMYVSEPEDAALFPDGSVEQAVFARTHEALQRDERTYAYSPRGLIAEYEHFSEHYDPLKIALTQATNAVIEPINAVSEAEFDTGGMYIRMTLALVGAHLPAYLRHVAVNFVGGVVRSVAVLNTPLLVYALLVLLACAAYCVSVRKRPECDGARRFWGLSLLALLLNAGFCAFGVFTLSRYMFYCFPFFYIGLYLAVRRLYYKSAHVHTPN